MTNEFKYEDRYCKLCGSLMPLNAHLNSEYCSKHCKGIYSTLRQYIATELDISYKEITHEQVLTLINKRINRKCKYCDKPIPLKWHGKKEYCSDFCKNRVHTLKLRVKLQEQSEEDST